MIKLTGKVIKMESASEWSDHVQRIWIRLPIGHGSVTELCCLNYDGLAIDTEVEVTIKQAVSEPPPFMRELEKLEIVSEAT